MGFFDYIDWKITEFANFDYAGFFTSFIDWFTFETFLKIIVGYFFVLWISVIIWVTKDIINRTNNIFYQIVSILTVIFWTPLWVVIYLLIRPSKTLFEKHYEELDFEEEASYTELLAKELEDMEGDEKHMHCPKCDYKIESSFKFCPNCRVQLKHECYSCKKELREEWTHCPYCWKDQERKVENILKEENKEGKKDKKKKNKENKKES